MTGTDGPNTFKNSFPRDFTIFLSSLKSALPISRVEVSVAVFLSISKDFNFDIFMVAHGQDSHQVPFRETFSVHKQQI